ncbi:arginine N-succinyltransferase [Shewanella sp. GXUN23E]|uniref:arginine N-succinyltransferase n=1 Tax=Shewanella sp. GXUN23E TaxID=3422498 RepID=UPI003D7EF138
MTKGKTGFSGLQVLAIILLVILLTIGATYWIVRTYIFPSPFTPVDLSEQETLVLDTKLAQLGWQGGASAASGSHHPVSQNPGSHNRSAQAGSKHSQDKAQADGDTASSGAGSSVLPAANSTHEVAVPQPYSESGLSRNLVFSEREVNAIIARNPDFATRVAIDFSDNLASASILIPVPTDFPIMPGETLRVNTGLNISLDANNRPVISLAGISLMGVPLPNAWLGNIKQVNLVGEVGDLGFWNTFADGVESIAVNEGELKITLKP